MTNPMIPTAHELMAEAVRLARRADSTTNLTRARLLFDMAKEIHNDELRRAFDASMRGIPLPPESGESAPATPFGEVYSTFNEPCADMGNGREETRKFTVPSLGHQSECAHCGTPIYLAQGSTDPKATVWVHRYTQQAVCVSPITANDITDTVVHTFAEPIGE